MAWQPDYATLAVLKADLGIPAVTTTYDAALSAAITAASRAIDHATNRQFGVLSAAAARYYTPQTFKGGRRVIMDDLMTTTDLVVKADDDNDGVFERTITSTEYRLYPWNAAADGMPWTILFPVVGTTFPSCERSMEITAKWGWTAVPAVIQQACTTQASRLFKRKDAPFGVAGSLEQGSEIRLLARLDPDVERLVSVLRRYD